MYLIVAQKKLFMKQIKNLAVSKNILAFLIILICNYLFINAQSVTWPSKNIIDLTFQWKGERFSDGRPKVPDELLERLKNIAMEEAWSALKKSGYLNQFENFNGPSENPWIILHPDQVMTGRVVTAQYIPPRPDLQDYVQDQGKKENNPFKITNSAPINILTEGDVYVADGFNNISGGLIGSNLANAIWAGSKRGFIFNGSVRDLEDIRKIDGLNGWFRGSDPKADPQGKMLVALNGPIRIGKATVLPGDVVLAKNTGVIFIPSYLVADIVISGEYTALLDEFTQLRINDKTYEYKNEGFVGGWTEKINNDFLNWLNHYPNLPMPKNELDDYIKAHPITITRILGY